jgi:hypothetical protein
MVRVKPKTLSTGHTAHAALHENAARPGVVLGPHGAPRHKHSGALASGPAVPGTYTVTWADSARVLAYTPGRAKRPEQPKRVKCLTVWPESTGDPDAAFQGAEDAALLHATPVPAVFTSSNLMEPARHHAPGIVWVGLDAAAAPAVPQPPTLKIDTLRTAVVRRIDAGVDDTTAPTTCVGTGATTTPFTGPTCGPDPDDTLEFAMAHPEQAGMCGTVSLFAGPKGAARKPCGSTL